MAWILKNKTEYSITHINTLTNEEVKSSMIYNHKELGVFYIFDSLLTMPYQRKYVFSLIQEMEKLGIDKRELQQKLGNIMDLCRDKPNGFEMDIYSIASGVSNFMKDIWDYRKSALMVTSLMVFQENENIGQFEQSISEQKISTWSKDPDMLDFFLNKALERCNQVSNIYTNLTQKYSQASQAGSQ